jgi:hypothetical protein
VIYTQTIDVDAGTRVGLTGDHVIVVEGSVDGFTYARMAIGDVDGLAQALVHMRELRACQLARPPAETDLPIDDGMRRAIFAALRGVYGREMSRGERLSTISLLVDRQVTSLSARYTDLTRAEGGRVLNILNTLGGDRRSDGRSDGRGDGGGWHDDGDPD